MSERVTKEAILRLWDPETRRCAQCWEPVHLVEQWDGSAALICENGCEPGGHVSDIYVRYEQSRAQALAWQAAANYPDLAAADGIYQRSRDEVIADAVALWGDDQDMTDWIRANRPERGARQPVAPPPAAPARVRPLVRAVRRRRVIGRVRLPV